MKVRNFSTKRSLPLVALLLGMVCCSESKEVRVQKLLLKGNSSLKNGHQDQALYYYDQALQITPCFSDALNNSGTIHHDARNFREALMAYDKAIECDSSYLKAYFNRANTLYELRQYDRSLADLEFISAIKPDTAPAFFTRGLVLTKLKSYPAAIAAFQKAMDLQPNDRVDCMVNVANVRLLMKDYEEAKKILQESLVLDPNEPTVHNSLCLIATEQNELDIALRSIDRALHLAPKEPYFLNNRGYIYLRLDQLEQAEADFNESISIDPYNGWAYRNKGILCVARRDFPQAERLLKQALVLDESVERAHFYLGTAYYQQGKKDLACSEFRKSDHAGDNMVTADLIKECNRRASPN